MSAEVALEFEAHRGALRALAYRMTGSRAEADDLVQEAWLRWSAVEPASVRAPRAWLVTCVTRLCIDHAKSARVRRETYVGPWLPEPVATAGDARWIATEADRETLSLAFMVVLERLSPLERAAFLLHEVFEYEHGEIAAMLERDARAVRQLVHRARAHLDERRVRFAPSREEHARMLQAFVVAMAAGDAEGLARLLADEVTSTGDGNGRRGAARKVVFGRELVARLWCGVARLQQGYVTRAAIIEANGWPAMLVEYVTGERTLLAIETDGREITRVMSVLAQPKLEALAGLAGASQGG